jgi:hypothetical protein
MYHIMHKNYRNQSQRKVYLENLHSIHFFCLFFLKHSSLLLIFYLPLHMRLISLFILLWFHLFNLLIYSFLVFFFFEVQKFDPLKMLATCDHMCAEIKE